MKHIFFCVFLVLFLSSTIFTYLYAEEDIEDEYLYVEERMTQEWSELVIPEDINWTQRFILSEMKELRVDLEVLRRNIYNELNERELRTVDRALAYSWNMVNFLWLILTMAVTGFGLVGWKTMKDVRENLSKNFEKQVAKQVRDQQKALEVFMKNFQQEQLAESQEILKNQEYILKRQEIGYYWSQYNREENNQKRLELLDKIDSFVLEENTLLVIIERVSIYAELWLWEKVLEITDTGLQIESEHPSLLRFKAEAQLALEYQEEWLQTLKTLLALHPSSRDEIEQWDIFQTALQKIDA